MSKYPSYYSGLRLTAALLSAGQWDKTMKTAVSSKTNTTLANDGELSGIALGVGQWDVRMVIWTSNAAATGDLKTRWSFTGTWTTTALRMCIGPGPTNTGLADAITPYKARTWDVSTDSIYGLGASGAYTCIREESSTIVVSVAGNLALSWAQNSTDAGNATNVQPGSYVEVRKIAD